jgi:hypothetical protein
MDKAMAVSVKGGGTTHHHRLWCGEAECGETMESGVLGMFG